MIMRSGSAIFAYPCLLLSVLGPAFAAGSSPVADAAMAGDVVTVRALVQKKADVNASQPDGATAIQWAAYRNDLALADVLIAAGANVNTLNIHGRTPLMAAVNADNPENVKALIAAGATE